MVGLSDTKRFVRSTQDFSSYRAFRFVEKEQARMMINSALQGLKESERTNNTTDGSVDLNSLTTFVEK